MKTAIPSVFKAISANGGSHLRFEIALKQRLKAFFCPPKKRKNREKAKRFKTISANGGSHLRFEIALKQRLKAFFCSQKKRENREKAKRFKMFVWGCAGGLLALMAPPLAAQNQMPSKAVFYDIVQRISGHQSPLFLFSGLDLLTANVIRNDDIAFVSIDSVTIPDGPDFGKKLFFKIQPTSFGLLEIERTQLPRYWNNGKGQTLLMTGPADKGPIFSGFWDTDEEGFFSFELDLGDVTYSGEGISYRASDVIFTLRNNGNQVELLFRAKRWKADYSGSLDGSETAENIRLTITAPAAKPSSASLLTLANRFMGALLGVKPEDNAENINYPTMDDLDGLNVAFELPNAQWDTRSPPAKGDVSGIAFTLNVMTNQATGASKLVADFSMHNAVLRLADNLFSIKKPLKIHMDISGINHHKLAAIFYGLNDHQSENTESTLVNNRAFRAGKPTPIAATIDVSLKDMLLNVPSLSFESTLTNAQGKFELASNENKEQTKLQLSGNFEDLSVSNFLGKDTLQPLAKELIEPMMPQSATLNLALVGLDRDMVQSSIEGLVAFDLKSIIQSLPKNIDDISIVINDSNVKNQLMDLDISGDFNLNGSGRIPIRGELFLQLGSIVPIQLAAQKALSTPIPEVVQILSASVVAMSVFQSYSSPTDGDRFDYNLIFNGGLPTINGRKLPRLPGLN